MIRLGILTILVAGCLTASGQQQEQQQAVERRAAEFLEANDENSDGMISKDEAKGRLKSNFSRVDRDGNGQVDQSELVKIASQLLRNGQSRKNLQQQKAAIPENVELQTDVPYRTDHQRQKLDLMLPADEGDGSRPAIVFIHGGGWRGGDKASGVWRSLPLEYASKGYVCISINYRLTPDGVNVLGCVEDCRCAVRWLRANAEKYNVDPDRIGAFGSSAGAHLVSLIGMTPNEKSLDGDAPFGEYSSGFQAVCCSAPPTNFRAFGKPNQRNMESLFGSQDGMTKASPLHWVTDKAPPFLIFHGTGDMTVPVKNGDDLNAALEEVEADVTYMRIDGAGHGVFQQHSERTRPAMEAFFERTLQVRQRD